MPLGPGVVPAPKPHPSNFNRLLHYGTVPQASAHWSLKLLHDMLVLQDLQRYYRSGSQHFPRAICFSVICFSVAIALGTGLTGPGLGIYGVTQLSRWLMTVLTA